MNYESCLSLFHHDAFTPKFTAHYCRHFPASHKGLSRRLVMQPSSNSRQILPQDVTGKRPYQLTYHVTIYLVSSLKAWHKPAHKHSIYSGFHWHLFILALQQITKVPVRTEELWVVDVLQMHTITLLILPLKTTSEMKYVIWSFAFMIYTWYKIEVQTLK